MHPAGGAPGWRLPRDDFATLGVAIVRGRAFTEADRPGAPEVAIVSTDVAARLWPDQDPIGNA